MQWSIGKKMGASFGVVLTVMIAVGLVSYQSTLQLIASAAAVAHTHRVLSGLEETLSAMKDAETGQRGYVITAEDRYLEPYRGARETVDQKVGELQKLIADNPAQQQRLAELQSSVATKFAELQHVIDVRRTKGLGPATQEVLTDRGKNAMDSIRRSVAAMEAAEIELLARRATEENELAIRTECQLKIIIRNIGFGVRWCRRAKISAWRKEVRFGRGDDVGVAGDPFVHDVAIW